MKIDKHQKAIFFSGLLILTGLIFLTSCQSQEQTPKIIGGSKDEHGCIGPAGFVWCPGKQKCIHSWEEACYETPQDQMKFLLAVKYGKKDINKVGISFEQKSGEYARGKFRLLPDGQMQGKVFLAAKINSLWVIVYTEGQKVDCQDLKRYNFPDELIRDICK